MLKRNSNLRRQKATASHSKPLSEESTTAMMLEQHLPKRRKVYGSSRYIEHRGLQLYTPEGTYLQNPRVPHTSTTSPSKSSNVDDHEPVTDIMLDVDPETPMTFLDKDRHKKRHARKKWNQARRWKDEVIPQLVYTICELERRTGRYRSMSEVRSTWSSLCTGCADGRSLSLILLSLEGIRCVTICGCKPMAQQLLRYGYFPCAPLRPSLAVDVNLLELTSESFLNMSPNISGWSETIEAYLLKRGHNPGTLESLRRRFGNALKWYTYLVDTKKAEIKELINIFRHAEGNSENTPIIETPSDYLRNRCPICFGGKPPSPNETTNIIVQLDANFTQKRRKLDGEKYGQDSPRSHPETVFIDTEKLKAEEEEVNRKRPTSAVAEEDRQDKEGDDIIEPGMNVPRSVLHECGKSFNAADEKRQASSTSVFADKGLAALLCRHDRVLWLANVTSPGERQFYALALLRELFKNLPLNRYRVGLLYDIACQLHRSCVKWDFLHEFKDQLFFAVSIFHAYGHQWACQIVYHPRKCQGFGLNDGEGCERFWSLLKLLIPTMRVSGFYQRLYTIDARIQKMDEKSLDNAGGWLKKKWRRLHEKLEHARRDMEAASALSENISKELLEKEWTSQIQAQTKPIPRYRRGTADRKIHQIIELKQDLSELREQEAEMEDDILGSGHRIEERRLLLVELRGKIKRTFDTVQKLRGSLSAENHLHLETLLGNTFLETRIRALGIKQRIRSRVCDRRFELSNVERASRNHANVQRLHSHVQEHVKRRDPTIAALVRKYNTICDELCQLQVVGQCPSGAIVPSKIDLKGLFNLDVDDEIWQDIGLDERWENNVLSIPRWMGDEGVRKGIKAQLILDRCNEEKQYLLRDRASIQDWMSEQWAATVKAKVAEEDENIRFVLDTELDRLTQLSCAWRKATLNIPYQGSMQCDLWGPILPYERESDGEEEAEHENEGYEEEYGEETFDEDQQDNMEEAEVLYSLEAIGLW